MKIRSFLIMCTIALSFGGFAFAQNTTKTNTGTLSAKEISKLSPKEQRKNAANAIKSMKSNLKTTNVLLDNAQKKESDIRKVNCVNEKVLSIKGYLKVSEESYKELLKAVNNSDKSASSHNYSLIMLGETEVAKLTDEASLCIGDVSILEGAKNQSTFTANPNMAPVEPVTTDGQFTTTSSTDPNLARITELTPFQ